ncbi:hypothetical protein PG988_003183 [Apiospora saccharicola]
MSLSIVQQTPIDRLGYTRTVVSAVPPDEFGRPQIEDDSPQSQFETLRRATVRNFFPAIQHVWEMHWGNLPELVGEERSRQAALSPSNMEITPTLYTPQLAYDSPPLLDPSHPILSLSPIQEGMFLRYLISFGMVLSAKMNQSPFPMRRRLILSKFAEAMIRAHGATGLISSTKSGMPGA